MMVILLSFLQGREMLFFDNQMEEIVCVEEARELVNDASCAQELGTFSCAFDLVMETFGLDDILMEVKDFVFCKIYPYLQNLERWNEIYVFDREFLIDDLSYHLSEIYSFYDELVILTWAFFGQVI